MRARSETYAEATDCFDAVLEPELDEEFPARLPYPARPRQPDTVDPRPLKARVTGFDVGEGFVSILHLPWHGRRAFMNRITSSFLVRTGAKNTRLRLDEVEGPLHAGGDLRARRGRPGRARGRAHRSTGADAAWGATFHLGILPEQRYEGTRESFDAGRGILKPVPLYLGSRGVFRGRQDGQEGLEATLEEGRHITRLFIDDDWSVYCQVVHSFSDDNGRVTIHEFGERLPEYLAWVSKMLVDEGVDGPFCISLAVRNLRRSEKITWAFPATDEVAMRPVMVDRIDDADVLDRFDQLIRRASRYGR